MILQPALCALHFLLHGKDAVGLTSDVFAVGGPCLLTGQSCLPSTIWQDPSHGSLAWLFGSPLSTMCAATGTRFASFPIQCRWLCSVNMTVAVVEH